MTSASSRSSFPHLSEGYVTKVPNGLSFRHNRTATDKRNLPRRDPDSSTCNKSELLLKAAVSHQVAFIFTIRPMTQYNKLARVAPDPTIEF